MNINSKLIEDAITSKTQAILATHVFGNPCNINEIDRIAKKYKLKVIYDGAHAFGSFINNKSILNYGDLSTVSFHSTKLMHTAEGGAIIARNKKLLNRISYLRHNGHIGDDYKYPGMNAKMSEIHAALGVINIDYLENIINIRKNACLDYDTQLNKLYENGIIRKQKIADNVKYNFAYYPIIFNSTKKLNFVKKALNDNNIYPRKYFYPSLNKLRYLSPDLKLKCEVSEKISKSILCLPLDSYIKIRDIKFITKLIIENI